jgi:hypothetical protein
MAGVKGEIRTKRVSNKGVDLCRHTNRWVISTLFFRFCASGYTIIHSQTENSRITPNLSLCVFSEEIKMLGPFSYKKW